MKMALTRGIQMQKSVFIIKMVLIVFIFRVLVTEYRWIHYVLWLETPGRVISVGFSFFAFLYCKHLKMLYDVYAVHNQYRLSQKHGMHLDVLIAITASNV